MVPTSWDLPESHYRLLALCAIRHERRSIDWSLIAREALKDPGLDELWGGRIVERSPSAERSVDVLQCGLAEAEGLRDRVDHELSLAAAVGARLVTVLDPDYPVNLRLVPNLPPFLFVRGELLADDVRAVAVVGTREASTGGLRKARQLACQLSTRHVTIVSGLARGIDTEAHLAALESGGRTVAVLGTGITRCYPAENEGLANRIVDEGGALVSQFWPSRPPGRDTFPRRNVVTSGISQGTVVIEATSTSGAKMQARLALEHGKEVFLLRSLVTDQRWARDYLKRGAIEVARVDDVLRHLIEPDRLQQVDTQRQQLTLELL
jgi:DNA processing protein